MNPITPLPPFAPTAPPPAPRILSLRATDLLAHLSRRLITNEDLPLKSSHFHPYKSKLFIFWSVLKPIHSTSGGPSLHPLSSRINDAPVPSTSAKLNVSRAARNRVLTSPLSSPSPTPDRSMSPSTSTTPGQPTSPSSPTPVSDHGNVESPRRNPYRAISSAGMAALKPSMKVRQERPKGAGRANLPRLLGWDDTLHEAVKVCDYYFLQYLF
jgi:hypothetical protein